MEFILYKFGDSFIVDFNNIENSPSELLDVAGAMAVLLKAYFKRTGNVSFEQRNDLTHRVLDSVRNNVFRETAKECENRPDWYVDARNTAIQTINKFIASGNPVSSENGDRIIEDAIRRKAQDIMR